MHKTINSQDFAAVIADSFDVLVDLDKRRGQVIGLKVTPRDGDPFIMPIAFESAKQLALDIGKVLLFAAPELMQL